jgi:hypothetical protein
MDVIRHDDITRNAASVEVQIVVSVKTPGGPSFAFFAKGGSSSFADTVEFVSFSYGQRWM